jgi:hypothetical protein
MIGLLNGCPAAYQFVPMEDLVLMVRRLAGLAKLHLPLSSDLIYADVPGLP